MASPLEGPKQQAEFGLDSTAGNWEGCQWRRKTVSVLFQEDTGQLGGKSAEAQSPAGRLLQ